MSSTAISQNKKSATSKAEPHEKTSYSEKGLLKSKKKKKKKKKKKSKKSEKVNKTDYSIKTKKETKKRKARTSNQRAGGARPLGRHGVERRGLGRPEDQRAKTGRMSAGRGPRAAGRLRRVLDVRG